MVRRKSSGNLMVGSSQTPLAGSAQPAQPRESTEPYLESPVRGQPHKGKVLLALQAHADDIPLMASGTVAKLIEEGYTGYLVRATNDDMGDSPGLGTPGTIGQNALANESDNAEVARILGCKGHFDLDYGNHRMADISLNELICRLILIIRWVQADTVVSWDPWAPDEENPDHYMLARGVEAACWMAGRPHDYPEQLATGLKPKQVQDKYYFARRPEITRVVDISGQVDKKIDAIRANRAQGPGGHLGSRLKVMLAERNLRLPLLGNDNDTADRNYIREFVLSHDRERGRQYGVECAEVFHYIPPGASGADLDPQIEAYVKQHAVPLK